MKLNTNCLFWSSINSNNPRECARNHKQNYNKETLRFAYGKDRDHETNKNYLKMKKFKKSWQILKCI